MNPNDDCIDFINPGTGRKFGEVRMASEEEVKKARRELAIVGRTWAAKPVKERARIVKKLQAVILDAADEITSVINQDHGKSRLDALHEVFMTIEKLHLYTQKAPKWLGRQRVPRGLYLTKRFYSERVPYGVVGIIGPWNYPLDLMMPPIFSALLAGNTVMVKPSEVAAATGVLLGDLFQRVPELAPYVRFLHGDARVGKALVDSKPDLLFLTGSTQTGQIVAEAAAKDMIPFLYELGGKDAMLVLEDADLDSAAKWGVWGAFYTSGQACTSVERVYVHEKVYDDFLAAVLEETKQVTVGYSPDIDSTYHMGPMTFERQCDIVNTHVQDAVDKGARVLTGGGQEGMFLEPTIVVDVDHSMDIMWDETFGPVMAIMKVENDKEAVRMANDSYMGLNAYVWSGDLDYAEEIGRQLEVGAVSINDTLKHYSVPQLPFGGVKLSGNTRTHGRGEVVQFSHEKAYSVSRPPSTLDPLTMVFKPGEYRFTKMSLGGIYGTNLPQRVEPAVDWLKNDPRGRKVATGAIVGGAVAAVVGLAAFVIGRR